MEETTIEIEVLIEFKEYLKLAYFNFFRKLWFIWLFVVIFSLYDLYNLEIWSLFSVFKLLLPYLLPPVSLVIYIHWLAKRNLKTSPVLKRVSIYQFSEDKISVKSEIFDSNLTWENVIKAHEKANMIILYTVQNAGFFLPVRCFENESQLVEFRELVRRKLGDKAKLKG